jgi:DNA topoisomerase-3
MSVRVILNVAEKPSVAKEIAKFLGGSNVQRSAGISKYNPVYEFPYSIQGINVHMRVTSVQGHVMSMDFESQYSDWSRVPIETLFDAPIIKKVTPDKEDLVKNLQNCSRSIHSLALWLDCDREGENIAYEVVSLVTQITPLHTEQIRRAHFSALTYTDIQNAAQNLAMPRLELSEAVDARQEIDLRLGAAFTRFQTMKFRNVIPQLGKMLISWGPCQFPTLGFVVNRYLEIQNFESEKFWTIDMKVIRANDQVAEFKWGRNRLFDHHATLVLYEDCIEEAGGKAKITKIESKEKSKWRPVPLATVPYQKLAASKLRLDSDKAMSIAEKLYNKGYISYPRTETDSFKSTINLKQLLQAQTSSSSWGAHAAKILENFTWPRSGSHDDNSHPPIHPVKLAHREQLEAEEWPVYELITRHFLACCSKDAKGFETVITAEMGYEVFTCKGLMITELNFLEVYPYQKWNESTLPLFQEGEEFEPNELLMNEHNTQPPSLLSEADLISAMDKSGIGTDATIHQHIKTIQDRKYAYKTHNNLFAPTPLGLALVEAYNQIGINLADPALRARMERGMNEIAERGKNRQDFVRECLEEMRNVYAQVSSNYMRLVEVLKKHITEFVNFEQDAPAPDAPVPSNSAPKPARKPRQRKKAPLEEIVEPQPLNRPADRPSVTCYKCGEPGHVSTNCTNPSKITGTYSKSLDSITCYSCKQVGHYATSCPNKRRN